MKTRLAIALIGGATIAWMIAVYDHNRTATQRRQVIEDMKAANFASALEADDRARAARVPATHPSGTRSSPPAAGAKSETPARAGAE